MASGLRSRSGPRDATPREPLLTTGTGIGKAPGKSVLIIDDSQVVLDSSRRVLEAEGYRVMTTTQTVGAARHLVDCDLALIDFHMPGFDGGACSIRCVPHR